MSPTIEFIARIDQLEGQLEKAERERDEALENYAAEYKLKVGCGSKLIEYRATIERIEALVERWRNEKQDARSFYWNNALDECARSLEAVLKGE